MGRRKMRTVTVIGRRWFDRPNGNTYHTAVVLVDGKLLVKTQPTYGYWDEYESTAAECL
jgi:hypothetical protein